MGLQAPLALEIKARLRAGEKPITLSKIYGKYVYQVMREMLVEKNPVSPHPDDSIDPNTPVDDITEDEIEVIDPLTGEPPSPEYPLLPPPTTVVMIPSGVTLRTRAELVM